MSAHERCELLIARYRIRPSEQALSYMPSKGIQYVAYDIKNDNSAKQRYKELGGRGVPLIIIGAHRMSGFSENNFEYYLNNHK